MEDKKEVQDILLTEEDVVLLNSKLGLRSLFRNKKVDTAKALRDVQYENELRKQQEELVKLQAWVIKNNEKVVSRKIHYTDQQKSLTNRYKW